MEFQLLMAACQEERMLVPAFFIFYFFNFQIHIPLVFKEKQKQKNTPDR